MKIFLACVIILFAFIFFKSDTWETYKVNETENKIEYVSVRHRLRWDRFFSYVKEIPQKVSESGLLPPCCRK